MGRWPVIAPQRLSRTQTHAAERRSHAALKAARPCPAACCCSTSPSGLSSNAALQRVRTLFARAKAGHVGSLDPLATGMLPICLGEATKIAGDILAGRKRYRFSVALGSATATGDAEGEVSRRPPCPR